MAECSHREKDRFLFISSFSVPHSVLKRFVLQRRENQSLFGIGFIRLKAFAAEEINDASMMIPVFDLEENIVRKGENAGHQHFTLLPTGIRFVKNFANYMM